MGRLLFSLCLLTAYLVGNSQSMTVNDFQLQPLDQTAINPETSRVAPQDGQIAALIKVVTIDTLYHFDGGALGLVGEPLVEPGAIWVYVPARSKQLTIVHPRFGTLSDYVYPVPIESGRTYSMYIDPGVGRFVNISTSMVPRSVVYLDGDSIGLSPIYRQYIPYGTHELKAFNAQRRMEGTQRLDVTRETGDLACDIPMIDQSAYFGRVEITTAPQADIYLDDHLLGRGKASVELREGDYTVETRMKDADPAQTPFKVVAQTTTQLAATAPTGHVGFLNITSRPFNSLISVEGTTVESGTSLTLPVGRYQATIEHKGYESATRDYTVTNRHTTTDTVSLVRKRLFHAESFYFGVNYTYTSGSGVTGLIGGTYCNVDLQLSYTLGLGKTDLVYFYTSGDNNTYQGRATYKCNAFAAKAGYQVVLASQAALTPQLGYLCQTLSASVEDGSLSDVGSKYCHSLTIGAKMLYSPVEHLCLYVCPEYGVALTSDADYDRVSDLTSVTRGGFGVHVGLVFNF
ncbi:MAG: PEGA domain-containing protein [Bacteroidales bacterium]|nr:PEGA domain-containing protein [Bacteroidales bacterium]